MSEQPTATATAPEALRVTRLVESNYRRILSADITAGNRTLVVLQGPNEAGKTSALSGLIATLAGKKASPDMPIHAGEDSATVELELGDALRTRYRITRSWTAKGGSYLNVYRINDAGEQEKVTSPQSLLDSLVSDLSFDPLAFAKVATSNRQQDKEAAARMLFAAIGRGDVPEKAKAKKAALVEERRQHNAKVKELQAQLGTDPAPGEDLAEVTDADLKAQMDKAEAHNEQRRQLTAVADRLSHEKADEQHRIERLRAELAAAEANVAQLAQAREDTLAKLQALPPAISTDDLAAGLTKIREHNARVAQQQAYRNRLAQIKAAQQAAATCTNNLTAIDQRVEEILSQSDLGKAVPGLQLADGELKHNGVPFSQASGMRRLELSALIGMAANPALRILCIDEGDQLDDASLQRLIELAKARDYAVWMTAIRAGDETDPDTHIVPVCDGTAVSGGRRDDGPNATGPTATKPAAAFDPDEL